jgi:hypothetical protein
MEKFTLGRQEKENRVCELLREGKNNREIAKTAHVNFSEIKRIRDKYFNDEDEQSARPSKRSLALEMFQEGKSDLDIAMELDLSANEMLEYRQEYFILTGDDLMVRIYSTIGDDMSSLLTLYKEMQIEGISAEDAVWALSQNRTLKQMSQEYESLLRKLSPLWNIERLQKENQELAQENRKLSQLIEIFRDGLKNMPEQTDTDTPLADNNWTRKIHRRRPITNAEGVEKPEQGTWDPDPTKFFRDLT